MTTPWSIKLNEYILLAVHSRIKVVSIKRQNFAYLHGTIFPQNGTHETKRKKNTNNIIASTNEKDTMNTKEMPYNLNPINSILYSKKPRGINRVEQIL